MQKVTYTAVIEGGKMKLTMPAFGGGRGPGGPGRGPGRLSGPVLRSEARDADPGGPGGRGGQPQVLELSRVSTEIPEALPPRPAPISLPMPAP